jgi:protocatechuate 3,4-dioxygenase beta subunit
MPVSRRRFLKLGLAVPAPLFLIACSDDAPSPSPSAPDATPTTSNAGTGVSAPASPTAQAAAQGAGSTSLAPTPDCGDADDLTVAQTEGPYFKASSPERQSLLDSGISGTKLVLEGAVVSRSCRPIARALVDFWQCDAAGNYDNTGFRLRGHQFTDANGHYRLETVLPGLYPGRTRHIHVKVQAPNQPVLTTQLYFPNEAGNRNDGIFNQALVLDDYRDAAGGKAGNFDFVLNIG